MTERPVEPMQTPPTDPTDPNPEPLDPPDDAGAEIGQTDGEGSTFEPEEDPDGHDG